MCSSIHQTPIIRNGQDWCTIPKWKINCGKRSLPNKKGMHKDWGNQYVIKGWAFMGDIPLGFKFTTQCVYVCHKCFLVIRFETHWRHQIQVWTLLHKLNSKCQLDAIKGLNTKWNWWLLSCHIFNHNWVCFFNLGPPYKNICILIAMCTLSPNIQ